MALALLPLPGAWTDFHARSSYNCASHLKTNLALLLKQRRHSPFVSTRVWFRPLSASLKQSETGTRDEGWPVERILAIGETLIVVLGAASHISMQLRASVASTTSPPGVGARQYPVSSFQVILLWAVLLINAFLRTRRGQSVSSPTNSSEVRASAGSQLTERVKGLEEEMRQGLILSRGVARQLEKLGIRVRTIRQTLRNPIQATTRVATETFEVMGALVSRQDILEKQLEELTQALLSMQEQQGKQLKLVSTALRKMSKSYYKADNGCRSAEPSNSIMGVDGRTALGSTDEPEHPRETIRVVETRKQTGRAPPSNGDWPSSSPRGQSGKIAN